MAQETPDIVADYITGAKLNGDSLTIQLARQRGPALPIVATITMPVTVWRQVIGIVSDKSPYDEEA